MPSCPGPTSPAPPGSHARAVCLWPLLVGLVATGCSGAPDKAKPVLHESTSKDSPSAVTRPAPRNGDNDMRPDVIVDQACRSGGASDCLLLGRRFKRRAAGHAPDAFDKFKQACDLGNHDACAEQAVMHQNGWGTQPNPAAAKSLLERACNAGSALGCSRLAGHHLMSKDGNHALAVGLSEAGCKGGDGLGCFNLALMLARGDGIPKDSKRAAQLYRAACKLNVAQACRQLGMAYAEAEGVPLNTRQAAAYNLRACNLGDANGCGNAGFNYQRGIGIPENPKRASKLFMKACRLGEKRYCELLQQMQRVQQTLPRPAPATSGLVKPQISK